MLHEKYKELHVVSVKTTAKALAMLEEGRVDAVVDVLPVLSYEIVKGQYRDLVISKALPDKLALKAMFRKELKPIRDIFNLALDSITKEERERIESRYDMRVVYVLDVHKIRYFKLIIAMLVIFLVIALFFGVRFYREIRRRKIAEELLRRQTIHDPLTQLYNRRFFNEFMKTELEFAKRYGATMLFGIFDVDYFKLYNDRYGHLEGDEVLKAIAKEIREVCKRKSDFVFRLGGEEFGVYIRLQDNKGVGRCIDKMLKSVESLRIEHKDNEPYGVVTISLGVVIVKVHPSAEVTLEDIYRRADELMYEAKKEGKNRAVFEELEFKPK